jgi:hypothetical protein
VQAIDGIDGDEAEELMSIDEEDASDDDGVVEGLKEGDSEADIDAEELISIDKEDAPDDDGVVEGLKEGDSEADNDAEELISIDKEDAPDDDGVAKGLKDRDSEADNDPRDEYVSAVEDTRLSEETLASDEVTTLEVVEDGVAAPFEDETMIDELVLSADELSVKLAVDEMSELITDGIVLDAEDD